MDPWLQSHWRDVHTAVMIYARDAIQSQLPGDLFARVEESVNIDDDDDEGGGERRTAAPDVKIVETPLGEFWTIAETASATAVAEPLLVPSYSSIPERHIEILDASSGNRVVTAIEWLSPTNKDPYSGREKYRRKQRAYLHSQANLVEIDLLRGGVHTVAIPFDLIPERRRSTYGVCVYRSVRPEYYEYYPISLREPLPTIRIPLRPRDGDITLNLQQLIDECYVKGRYRATIDYRAPAFPPLEADEAEWASECLKSAGVPGVS